MQGGIPGFLTASLNSNGAIRRVHFLMPMTASILSNNRVHAPFGAAGGGAGALGNNYIERADGTREGSAHIGRATWCPTTSS